LSKDRPNTAFTHWEGNGLLYHLFAPEPSANDGAEWVFSSKWSVRLPLLAAQLKSTPSSAERRRREIIEHTEGEHQRAGRGRQRSAAWAIINGDMEQIQLGDQTIRFTAIEPDKLTWQCQRRRREAWMFLLPEFHRRAANRLS
jgi:hypothetical protein